MAGLRSDVLPARFGKGARTYYSAMRDMKYFRRRIGGEIVKTAKGLDCDTLRCRRETFYFGTLRGELEDFIVRAVR